MNYDWIVGGGGIVGLAAAKALLRRHPGTRLLLLEKEPGLARHQSGRNSGVIHSGIYYAPGGAKARLCRDGYSRLLDFARSAGIPFEICGKVIVAVREQELPALERLRERAAANGLQGVERLEPVALREREPAAAGLAALHVPQTGIIDFREVCGALARQVRATGATIAFGEEVVELSGGAASKTVRTRRSVYETGYFLNCGGLYSDRLARLDGLDPGMTIAPFRGEYYQFRADAPRPVRHLIYPVPDPAFPFLGVHFTRTIDGGMECGPNAVPAWGREAYGKLDGNLRDAWELLRYPGFRRLVRRHWRHGVGEIWRSLSKAAFVRALQRLVPQVRAEWLVPRPAGIRAQALRIEGSLVDDFAFARGERSLHVLNAPSPAATAALAIAQEIVRQIEAG